MACVNTLIFTNKLGCESNLGLGSNMYCIETDAQYCNTASIVYSYDTVMCSGGSYSSYSSCVAQFSDCEYLGNTYCQCLNENPVEIPEDPLDIMSIAIGAGVGGGILIVIAIVIGLVCSRRKKLGTAPTYVQQQQSVMYPTGVQNNVYQQSKSQPQQYDYSQPQPIQQAQPVQQQLYIAQPQEQAFDQQQLYGMPQSSINVQKSNATVSIDWQAVM
ncbi:Hypothetical_protein [Hexamita inflata]|uniref:Hypothetical_protein n=1 Tax=Hexamita inflata TaxID=28002 RepID=A0ABP1H7I6_9EUKA